MVTVFNHHAKNKDEDSSRIRSGIDKLYGTTEQERIALYEAALIRYFSPPFNKEFKNSFPSTNLKILQDCYEKDFAAVIAEICALTNFLLNCFQRLLRCLIITSLNITYMKAKIENYFSGCEMVKKCREIRGQVFLSLCMARTLNIN